MRKLLIVLLVVGVFGSESLAGEIATTEFRGEQIVWVAQKDGSVRAFRVATACFPTDLVPLNEDLERCSAGYGVFEYVDELNSFEDLEVLAAAMEKRRRE